MTPLSRPHITLKTRVARRANEAVKRFNFDFLWV